LNPNERLQNTIELAFQDLSTGRLRPQFWTAKPIRLPSIGEFSDIHIYDNVAICIGLEQIDQLQATERRFGNYICIDLDEKTQYSFSLPVQQLPSLDSTLPTADQLIYGALTKMRVKGSKSVEMEVELVYDLDDQNERFHNLYQVTENLSFKNLAITADLIYPEPGEINVMKFNVTEIRKLRLVTYV